MNSIQFWVCTSCQEKNPISQQQCKYCTSTQKNIVTTPYKSMIFAQSAQIPDFSPFLNRGSPSTLPVSLDESIDSITPTKKQCKTLVKEILADFIESSPHKQIIFSKRRSLNGYLEIYSDESGKPTYKLPDDPKVQKRHPKGKIGAPIDNYKSNMRSGINLYQNGEYKAAYDIFQAECKQDVADAHGYVALMLEFGLGVDKNVDDAVSHYETGTTMGSLIAIQYYANHLESRNKVGLAKDVLLRGIIKENPECMYKLGEIYLNGRDTIASDPVRAKALIEMAAKSGNPDGLFQMSCWYSQGFLNLVKKNPKKESDFLQEACLRNHPDALYQRGRNFRNEQNHEAAVKVFTSAVDLNHPDAMCYLGNYYKVGNGGLKKDLKKALDLFERAANSPHYNHVAMHQLGLMYIEGEIVNIDFLKAAKLFAESKRKGNNDGGSAWRDLYLTGKIKINPKIESVSRESEEGTVMINFTYEKDIPFTPEFIVYRNGHLLRELTNTHGETKFYDDLHVSGTYSYQLAVKLFQKESDKGDSYTYHHYVTDTSENSKSISKRYVVSKKLAQGGQGKIFLCKDLKDKTGAEYVMKMRDNLDDFDHANMALQEAMIPLKWKHSNILTPITAYISTAEITGEPYVCIIMNYHKNGDLCKYIKTNTLSKRMIVTFALQILSGLEFIHAQGAIHRDIKPENVLISDDLRCLISDFGSMRETDTFGTKSCVGTVYYASPEMRRGQKYSFSTDMYSFGGILYYMVVNKHPIFDESTILSQHIHETFVFNFSPHFRNHSQK